MSFGMSSNTTEAGSNGHTGALFEGLDVPADSAAVLKRSMPQGAPRVQSAVRNQVELRACDLDASLPADHQARAVWAFVQSRDLQALYARIRAVEGSVGRAPIDPAILMSLWLYATLDGVGSARELERLCDSDEAYRWLCGGVGVNHHTLGDFRRVRAARQRAAAEREQRIGRAIKAMDEIDKSLSGKSKKRQAEAAVQEVAVQEQPEGEQATEQTSKEPKQTKKPKEPRVSTTDHEARVMKMADGGFRPAFNAQLAVDTATLIITGVDLINSGSDMNQMLPMHEQHQDRYARVPEQWLADGGFAKHEHIEQLDARATKVFAPVVAPRDKQRDRHERLPGDSDALGQWRERMGTDEAKQIYKERAASIECANAHLRNRGLQRFNVRGLCKARAVLLWHALAHNLKRMMALNFAFAA